MPARSIPTESSSPHRALRSRKRRRRPASPSSTRSGSSAWASRSSPRFCGSLHRSRWRASGPAGSLTEVRIRGAEANHTLLFVDGIKINDPASGDSRGSSCSTPTSLPASRSCAGRNRRCGGPKRSAASSRSMASRTRPLTALSAEGGSFGFARGTASAASTSDATDLSGAIGWQRATGIDSFNGRGDKDGYQNLSGRLRGTWKPSQGVEIGASGLALTGRSEFDGFDRLRSYMPTRSTTAVTGCWLAVPGRNSAMRPHPGAANSAHSLLGSSNRNFLADQAINRTSGNPAHV